MADMLSITYGALADPTRRGIVEQLAVAARTVAELRRPLAMSAPAVSKHLRVLESAALIERRRAGRNQVCTLRRDTLVEARRWLDEQFRAWSGPLDSLDSFEEREEHPGEDPR
jgi:DNA-binding transcriptional ArsR family regulator